ncbi:MAG: type II toxin-antitoxin system RelE/ParE family toxin [Chloroflexota bacterium]|nr:type II toxin-antitoxin system RelE/ParE family toxin [Chloroflexota bacterium]MDQ6905443.1 type II toxin-antitoxin system RelE/ParE family toxin [Chloroflexota bacterium]
MSYEVRFTPAVDRQIGKLPRGIRPKIIARAEALADNPRPHGVKRLTNAEQGTYRIREGDYRIVYDIEDDVLLVLVVRVAHRREVYR